MITITLSCFNPLEIGSSVLSTPRRDKMIHRYGSFNPLEIGSSVLSRGQYREDQRHAEGFNPLEIGSSVLRGEYQIVCRWAGEVSIP